MAQKTYRVEAPCEGYEIYFIEAESEAEALEHFYQRGEFERFEFVSATTKPHAEEL